MKTASRIRVLATAVSIAWFGLAPGAGLAETVNIAGSSAPISTVQPSLALTPIVRVSGDFYSIGEVKWFAGDPRAVPADFAVADGSVLAISQNSALYSKFGTTYGGDGRTSFALPDLRGRAAVGSGGTVSMGQQLGAPSVSLTADNLPAHDHVIDGVTTTSTGAGTAFNNLQPGLGLSYQAVDEGIFPSRGGSVGSASDQTLGFLRIDAAVVGQPPNTTPANGAILPIAQNQALFALLGTTYGGDGRITFGLPDMTGRIPVGVGTGPGLSPEMLGQREGSSTTTLSIDQMAAHLHGFGSETTSITGSGTPISNIQPEIGLNWVIALNGYYPSSGSASDPFTPFIGELALFAGNFAPSGWTFAAGQLLQISQNSTLFSILGTTYGGDGRVTFALPDLRGRTPIGAGYGGALGNLALGTRLGTEANTMSLDQLAAHSHDFTPPQAPVPLPAGLPLLAGALALLGFAARRRQA